MRDYLPFGQPSFTDAEIDAVARVLRSGWVGMGPETLRFEEELAAALQVPEVVTVSSCTAAMTLSLRALGVGPGDEVVVPSLTWCSTANAALYLGARAIFADIDPDTMCLSPAGVQAVLSPRTKVVMPVHFGGLAADIDGLRAVLPASVHLVEDAAHAFGAQLASGRPVGSSGHPVCFSFYANKTLSTAEGGAVALADARQAAQLRSLRQHALHADAWKRFTEPRSVLNAHLTELGFKANYTDLQAAIGRVQLARQAELAARRLAVAQRYVEGLAGLPLRVQPQLLAPGHARHLFLVQLDDGTPLNRDELLLALRARHIGATLHYEPLHHMPLYRHPKSRRLPHTERVARRVLTLPIGPSLSATDADDVVAAMHSLLA